MHRDFRLEKQTFYSIDFSTSLNECNFACFRKVMYVFSIASSSTTICLNCNAFFGNPIINSLNRHSQGHCEQNVKKKKRKHGKEGNVDSHRSSQEESIAKFFTSLNSIMLAH